MDVHPSANAQRHLRVNGDNLQTIRPGEEDTLRFLSQEEKECLRFFEKTIDSLEDSLEVDELRPRQAKPPVSTSPPAEEMDGPIAASSPTPMAILSSLQARPATPKDHDIIDLVHPGPDLVQTKQLIFSPTDPDFQSMMPIPDSHFEIKARHDPVDHLPSEYNPPLPSGSYESADSPSPYHPPGCIPTPVLIAQKIAENQAGGTSNLNPASAPCRLGLESEKPPSNSTDLVSKQGPPTTAKPTRFPANISIIMGSKEHQNQSLPNVNIQERRALMLANLSGTSHTLLQEDPKLDAEHRNQSIPSRSVSFRDPTPEKSRMEALSKLGLTRNRAMSGDVTVLDPSNSNPPSSHTGAETSTAPPEVRPSPTTDTSTKPPEADTPSPQSQTYVDRKPELLQLDPPTSHEEKKHQKSLPPLETKASLSPPPEVSLLEFNSYGGKSIVVNPSVSLRSESVTPPISPEPKTQPPALANPSEFNSYGGKTKVMTPVVAVHRSEPFRSDSTRSDPPWSDSTRSDSTRSDPPRSDPPRSDSTRSDPPRSDSTRRDSTRSDSTRSDPPRSNSTRSDPPRSDPPQRDLPDILSSHIDKSHTMPARSGPLPTELNSYGGKSRNFNPSMGLNRPSDTPAKTFKPPPPAPNPKPPRHSYHLAGHKPVPRALSPDHKRRSNSLFRPQGITVQFSGRGASDESRREALRKLGLLKDS
ncbi:uncharacterized protein proser2 [Aulostomus maculatus]